MTLSMRAARAAGLAAPITASQPPVSSNLWTFVLRCQDTRAATRLAGEIVKHLPASGRARVEALYKLMAACPMAVKPAALRVLRRCNPGHAGWQALIMYFWLIDGSHVVVDGAGDRDTLQEWFEQADLVHGQRHFGAACQYATDDLPELVPLYRGGSRELDVLDGRVQLDNGQGHSGLYARKRQVEHGGQAIVLTLTVIRDDILFCPKAQAEAVLVDAAAGTVDTADPVEIEQLATLGTATLAAWHEQCLRIDLPGDDGWHGWTGDE